MWKHALLCLLFCPTVMAQSKYGNAAKPGSMAHAQTGCPWLTEGSAAHALGGDVSVTAKVSDMGEGRCSFVRQQDSLEILVSKAALPTCPGGSTALRGIGNEAWSCMAHASQGEAVEMISSRVRDFHLVVTLTTHAPKRPPKPEDLQNDALEQVAEQVAGNLY